MRMNLRSIVLAVNQARRKIFYGKSTAIGVIRVLIDEVWYTEKYKSDSSVASLGALEHFMKSGWLLGYDPSPHFWTLWYLETYPDVARAGINPLLHFVTNGASEGRNPSPLFDSNWYWDRYSDVLRGENALLHYLNVGRFEARSTSADSEIEAFLSTKSLQALPPVERIQRLVRRSGEVGKECFYQAQLSSGRNYLSQLGRQASSLGLGRLGRDLVREFKDADVHAQAPYFTTFDDVFVIPGSATIIPMEGLAINDEIQSTSSGNHYEATKSWDKAWANNGRILIKYKSGITPPIQSGIHLFKEYEKNYFHFVVELSTKLHLIEKDNIFSTDIPILMSDDLEENLYEIVEAIKSPERKVIKLKRDVPYKVEKLHYVSDISKVLDKYNEPADRNSTFLSPSVIKSLSRFVRNKFCLDSNKASRIVYLPRPTNRRGIKNQPELIEALIDRRFEVVAVDYLNFASQVRLFNEVEVVVGASGAAFTNMLWCNPGTKVVILNPNHPLSNKTFWEVIGRAMKLDIYYFDGPRCGDIHGKYAMHDNFTVDVDAVLEVVRSFSDMHN